MSYDDDDDGGVSIFPDQPSPSDTDLEAAHDASELAWLTRTFDLREEIRSWTPGTPLPCLLRPSDPAPSAQTTAACEVLPL